MNLLFIVYADGSFLYHCEAFCRTCLYIWVAWRVSNNKQKLLTIREHMSSSPFFVGSVLLIHLVFCVYLLTSVFWCLLRFPHKNDVRFFIISIFFVAGAHALLTLIWVCLGIMVSKAYYVVFLFSFSYHMYNIKPISLDCHFLLGARVAQWVRSLDLTALTSLSPIRREFTPSFVNYKKGALDSHLQVIKFTSCLPRIGGSFLVLRLLPPLKLVAMIYLKYFGKRR
jgi:hypothetical protein